MDSSCSFRITRTAEDLAQTLNALSQRLVKLEQRQEAIELQLRETAQETPAEEIKRLDGVDQILKECQGLLEISSHDDQGEWECMDSNDQEWSEGHDQSAFAA